MHSKTTRRGARRVSKVALARVKLATIVAAVVLFLGSLTGIAVFNPGVQSAAAVPAQPQQIIVVRRDGSQSQLVVPRPNVLAVPPLVRSRGS
ncbi:MAG: hypothetical protein ACK2UC_14930 [Anaerolineae bacterium]|jgi:hypothetical protein